MSSRFYRFFGPSRLFIDGPETIRRFDMRRSHIGFTAKESMRIRDFKAILFLVSNLALCEVSSANTAYQLRGAGDPEP